MFGLFRRPALIKTPGELGDFIDQRAAFVTQKGIYEYSRARAGHYAKVLFAESEFREAVEQSRWRAYPLGLAMVTELAEGLLRPQSGEAARRHVVDRLADLVLSVFDRYPVPSALGSEAWDTLRADLSFRLNLVGAHAVKPAKDVPEPYAQSYFDLLPIHKKLRSSEFPTIRNYLRVTMCNIHEELEKRLDSRALAQVLLSEAERSPVERPPL